MQRWRKCLFRFGPTDRVAVGQSDPVAGFAYHKNQATSLNGDAPIINNNPVAREGTARDGERQ